jgi:hypothetical protein
MRAYKMEFLHKSYIIVHSKGLPPSWKETNIDKETEERALEKGRYGMVVHLDAETLEVLESYEIK